MGARGPKPGYKHASLPPVEVAAAVAAPLSAADRENPKRLSGEALRALAYRRGVSRSDLALMSDEKLRMELLYRTYQQYTETEA